ncbi:hypothetical protein [Rhodopila sp.]
MALAYKATALQNWGGRAAMATASVFIAAIFAAMTLQIIGSGID